MVRSLYSAASGMMAQQTNVDVIANNLANVNTIGYKSQSAEFKSLLYQDLQAKTTSANGENKPVSAQVGLGSRISSITSHYTQGSANATDGTTDFLINGMGFFAIENIDGNVYYTRNGNFNVAVSEDGLALADSNGNPVLDVNGDPITFPKGTDSSKLSVDQFGNFMYPDNTGNAKLMGIQIGLANFPNPAGLERSSDTIMKESEASGQPTIYMANQLNSKIVSGYLEGSNVQAVDEMVNMIIAQRAYEMNSKAITASDEMLQQANNLRS